MFLCPPLPGGPQVLLPSKAQVRFRADPVGVSYGCSRIPVMVLQREVSVKTVSSPAVWLKCQSLHIIQREELKITLVLPCLFCIQGVKDV